MALRNKDLIQKISKDGKKDAALFLFEHAKVLQLPLANFRAFTKVCASVEQKLKMLKKMSQKKVAMKQF